MDRTAKIALAILGASILSSAVASLLGYRVAALWFGAPALVLSGWTALGHFITLDDDAPGGWSNPEDSSEIWRRSLGELAIKTCLFAAVVLVVVVLPLEFGAPN